MTDHKEKPYAESIYTDSTNTGSTYATSLYAESVRPTVPQRADVSKNTWKFIVETSGKHFTVPESTTSILQGKIVIIYVNYNLIQLIELSFKIYYYKILTKAINFSISIHSNEESGTRISFQKVF